MATHVENTMVTDEYLTRRFHDDKTAFRLVSKPIHRSKYPSQSYIDFNCVFIIVTYMSIIGFVL